MKTILFFAPSSVLGAVSSYPLIYKINDIFDDKRLHIIVPEGLEKYYTFFPFDISIHVFPENKNSFLGAHHFSKNLHEVFNVDLFFDLNGSSQSAFMGRSFGARERVGFNSKVNRFLLTHKVDPSEEFLDRQFLGLLEKYKNEKYSSFALGKKISVDKASSKNYILVYLDDLRENFSVWSGLFPLFEHINFVFWGSFEHEYNKKMIQEFDRDRGLFKYTTAKSFHDLNTLIEKSDAVITNQEWLGNISSIREKKTFSFVKNLKDLKKFRHIIFNGAHIEYDESSLVKLYGDDNEFIEVIVPSNISDYIKETVYPSLEFEENE